VGVKPGRREKTHAVCLSGHVWEGTGEALEYGGFGQGEFAEEGVGGGWRVGGMCKLPDGRIIKTEVVVMGEDEKPENWKLRKKDDEALTQDDQRCQPGSPLLDPPSTHLQRTGRPFPAPSRISILNPFPSPPPVNTLTTSFICPSHSLRRGQVDLRVGCLSLGVREHHHP